MFHHIFCNETYDKLLKCGAKAWKQIDDLCKKPEVEMTVHGKIVAVTVCKKKLTVYIFGRLYLSLIGDR